MRKVDTLLPHRGDKSLEDRARDIDATLMWLQKGGPDYLVSQFGKVPILLLDKRTPEQRSKDIDNALRWLHDPRNYAGPNVEAYQTHRRCGKN